MTELQKTITDLESQIGARSGPDSELETIDVVRKSQDAYNSLQSGDTEQAVRDAKEAVRVAEVLRDSGGATNAYLDSMTKQMADIVKQAAELDNKTITQKIDQVVEGAGEQEINLKPNLDMQEILRQAGASQAEVQRFYDQNPIKLRFDSSAVNNLNSFSDDISRQALKEGVKV